MSLFWALSLLASVCLAQTPSSLSDDPKSAEAGLAVYRRHCSSCHGNQADGGRAPNLIAGSLSETQMIRTISDGVSGSGMAAYGSRLSAKDIWRIVIFLNSAAHTKTTVGGNAAHGELLFWDKGGCATCHAIGTRGSFVGPDLSSIGLQRNPVYLRESLVDPDADIARGFDGVTVVTKDGKTLRGIERALDDFSIVLQDFSGKVYSFDRQDVQSVSRDRSSLMPEATKKLSAAEMNDVLAYLVTLRAPRAPEVRTR